ncbi:unnamed protein product [Brassicogethes aeneus]|uniref:Rap-GAP domain-containing protein n=1 Tax=Brassicogethes aeneus TaxID=1431903 RepID=A0A9P0FRC6_BRAAE|nr:unnamed protein product [Brassicogethes aeneus]
MSSKEKDGKNLTEKLKDFFKKSKNHAYSGGKEYQFPEEKLKDLSKESHITKRLNTLKDLHVVICERKLESQSIACLWSAVKDLFGRDYSSEIRHVAFSFLQNLIKGQNDRLQLMRAQFFKFIKTHDNPEDVGQRLELLNCLTTNGKNIEYFEEEVGPFLLNWFPDITRAGKILEYLTVIDNVVRYNAAYMSEDVISGFIQHICVLCCCTSKCDTIMACLKIMSTVVAYSNMSPESLPKFIGALCRTVTVENYCKECWKTMKNLLGTHMGHSALYTMCRILQEPSLQSEVDLLWGAVFYIHMALWGSRPLTNLHCPPSSVLPSFLQAIKSNHPSVAYEVIVGIDYLVNKYGYELQDPAWSIILEIILYTAKLIETSPNNSPNQLAPYLHKTINIIEILIDQGKFNGSIPQFYSVLEECASERPESSVLKLITYFSRSISPTEYLWLENLDYVMNKYFRPDVKTKVRLKVLDLLSDVIQLHGMQYEEELIDQIVVPHMKDIEMDLDVQVRTSVSELIVNLCLDCESKKCLELLNILDKLLMRPFNQPGDMVTSDLDLKDCAALIDGLIRLFTSKIHKLPSSIPLKVYDMLVNFLVLHYNKPKVFGQAYLCRYMIFNCFLKMRANSHYLLGHVDNNGKQRFSSYMRVWYPNNLYDGTNSSPNHTPPVVAEQNNCIITNVKLKPAFKAFVTCLRYDKDWNVLSLVLNEMPKALQNKCLILSRQGNSDIYLLVDVLCNMISDRNMNLPESLNVKVNKADFQALVLQVLVNMASYHSCLESTHQQKMIRCLMRCIQTVPRGSNPCISALTICTLEMREVMVKLLPEVLLNLSKISATVYIAIPVLEFLSTLTQLPMVFANFVADQYMAVFAISLPYTNPFKYDHYTVSLAHHVIAVWFLKCRLPFRRDFVKFITNGLQTNVLVPFEETSLKTAELSNLNEDSSDRKRSASLTEHSSRRRTQTMPVGTTNKPGPNFHRPTAIDRTDKNRVTFYEELTETCIDLMARYAFSPCSALPRRLPTAEFLLNGGQSECWLIGNKLVTVTTSGCSQKVLKHGLCDKCWTLCNDCNKNDSLRTARSGSNEQQDSSWVTRQNSNDKSSVNSPIDDSKKVGDSKLELLSTKLQQLVKNDGKNEKPNCACWCQGWAEIYVRRPTGDMSWVMRIQNQTSFQQSMYEFPLNEISTLFMPSLNLNVPVLQRQNTSEEASNFDDDVQQPTRENVPMSNPISVPDSPSKNSPSRQNSRDSVDDDLECYVYDDGTKSRNPVRRSNSSPEMSANWKNPFLREIDNDNKGDMEENVKKNKMYSKDMRVSCEAIPEEMGGTGTTPPSNEPIQVVSHHPSLLTSISYPGSSPPPKDIIDQKPYKTVPPSPNVASAGNQAPPDFHKIALKTFKTSSSSSSSQEKSIERPNNLPSFNLTPLSAKPPQSPTQTSPRLARHIIKDKDGHEIQKSSSSSILEKNSITQAKDRAKERKSSGSIERLASTDPNQTSKRERTNTIAVSSPATRKPRAEPSSRQNSAARTKEAPKNGINPSFVFLQLYHAAYFGNDNERPLLIGSGEPVKRAVRILDSIPPYETHKIGVLYIKQDQVNNEVEILKNRFGSLRYVDFLQNLGTLIKLADVDPQVFFLGGLEQSGNDGDFGYMWQDDVIRVTFHVATMMPNKETDPNCHHKKLHIGNNYVTIVYNESGDDYNINTIKGQFNFAAIVIQPLDHNTNRVVVKVKDKLKNFISISEPKLVSDQNVAILARQLALHCNLASLVVSSLERHQTDPYASNWLERLRKIKNVRNKILQEKKNEENIYSTIDLPSSKKQMEDFTDYT